ncbi:MAG: hypothetical protein FWD49_00835 [Firmicutes bacterium]|nr:hypothetical protein [Bacillota bacterium]
MNLYETMFKRRSVRKFLNEKLSELELNEIKDYLNGIKQLSGCTVRFELSTGEAVNDNHAPHYALAYCEPLTLEYINAGFVIQEFDLWLQAKGLGSLWLGLARPKSKTERQEYAIMIAFGKTEVPLRKGEQDFKRVSVLEMSNEDNKIARTARIAPSAVNDQPWKLTFSENKVNIDYFGRGPLKFILKKKMSKFDIGIVTRFTELALLNEGKQIVSITPIDKGNTFGTEIVFEG